MKKTVLTVIVLARLVLFLFMIILFQSFFTQAQPSGGTISPGTPETAPADSAGSVEAQAGNVTQIDITGYSVTQSWQGYFGNVSGTIELTDGNNNTLYNWTLASPEGEVYASTNSSIIWPNIQCFNFTANGDGGDESGNGGTTNLNGTNLSALETEFNVASDDVDGVDETFTFLGAGTHDLFYTAQKEFSEGECRSTRVFSSGGPTADQFEEVLLYEPSTSSVIYAALLEEASVSGFDSGDHDFEMLVLEDGHGANVATTTYYFFVELE